MKEVQQWSLGALGEVNRRGRRIRKKEIASGCKYPLGIREFFKHRLGWCLYSSEYIKSPTLEEGQPTSLSRIFYEAIIDLNNIE